MRGYRTCTASAVAWAILTTALGACSGEAPGQRDSAAASAASSAPASTDASGCELLTTEEIQAALGMAPDRANEGARVTRECDWSMADGRPLLGVVVGGAQRTYEEYMQNMREQMGSELERIEMTRVAGVGDYAIWHVQDGPSYLNAAQDGDLLVVMIWREPTSGKSKQEAAVELARKALARL